MQPVQQQAASARTGVRGGAAATRLAWHTPLSGYHTSCASRTRRKRNQLRFPKRNDTSLRHFSRCHRPARSFSRHSPPHMRSEPLRRALGGTLQRGRGGGHPRLSRATCGGDARRRCHAEARASRPRCPPPPHPRRARLPRAPTCTACHPSAIGSDVDYR